MMRNEFYRTFKATTETWRDVVEHSKAKEQYCIDRCRQYLDTTKLVASPRNFNAAKIEMEEHEREEKKLRKLYKKEKGRNSPSPERKLNMEKIKKSDVVDLRDLRTQFKDMVKETFDMTRRSLDESPNSRSFSPLEKRLDDAIKASKLNLIQHHTDVSPERSTISSSKPIYHTAKYRYSAA